MQRETTALILIVLILVACGVLMVYSATGASDGYGLLHRQIAYAGVGLLVFFLLARFDYHRLGEAKFYSVINLAALVMLVLVLFPPFGVEVDGARRWLKIGAFQFQPSEIAKFALLLWLAVKLTTNRMHAKELFRGFVPPFFMTGLYAYLIYKENDLGLPAVLLGVSLIVMWNAGIHFIYLVLTGLAGVAGVIYIAIKTPYRLDRLLAFLDPAAHRDDASFQLVQSLRGFAQGELWGQGLGAGEQKLDYLFAAHTDFIFSVIGEERGLFGSLFIVVLFMGFAFAAFRIVLKAPDMFGSMLACGCAVWTTFQAAFIMAVTVGLLPTKGMPLPFISYGGTALVVFLACAGVLVNIGAQVHQEETGGRSIVPGQQPLPAY